MKTKNEQDAKNSRFARAVIAGLLTLAAALGARGAAAQTNARPFLRLGDHPRYPPPEWGTVSTPAAADAFFITQWGPTAYNSGKAPYGYNDCGPATIIMTLASLGLIVRPEPEDAAATLDAVRDAALNRDSDYSELMGFAELGRALDRYGAKTTLSPTPGPGSGPPGLEFIEAAIERGNPLIIGGNPWKAWGKDERAAGNYLNSRDPGGHFVAVLGKTDEGLAIIGDPLVRNGTITVTSDQLAEFYGTGFGTMEVYRFSQGELWSWAGSGGVSVRK